MTGFKRSLRILVVAVLVAVCVVYKMLSNELSSTNVPSVSQAPGAGGVNSNQKPSSYEAHHEPREREDLETEPASSTRSSTPASTPEQSSTTTSAAGGGGGGSGSNGGKFYRTKGIFGSDLSTIYSPGPQANSATLPSPQQYRRNGYSCPQLLAQHRTEYLQVLSKVNLRRSPSYKLPWYYHDREALCGRFLLTYFDIAGEGNLTSDAINGVQKPTEETFKASARTVLRATVDSEKVEATRRGLTSTVEAERLQSSAQEADVVATAGEVSDVVLVSNCAANPDVNRDVLVTARLIGESSFLAAEVVPVGDQQPDDGMPRTIAPNGYRVQFTAQEPGHYALEIKVIHVNGSSDNPRHPRSLGVIGTRASDNNKKSFKHNAICDSQRHVYGSPLKVLVVAKRREAKKDMPLCTRADHRVGRWVPITSPTMCNTNENPYCRGDPTWLSDACAYNYKMLWAPQDCKFNFYTPPNGPARSCLRRNGKGFLLMIGDSVTREYGKSCFLFNLRDSGLLCLFNNIALEGQHYSYDYAKAVAKTIIDSIRSNRASVFSTNLGIHHMIGPSTTAQWEEFVGVFVALWNANNITFYQHGMTDPKSPWQLEVAVWLGPPTIHYARKGMGAQRAALWDAIAWRYLEPLGFKRLYAIGPTRPRQEGTWDGLHYASEKGKVQSVWRNKEAKVLPWNGGVANMLFTMLLNLVCNRPELS